MTSLQTQPARSVDSLLDAASRERIDREVAKFPAEQKQSAVMSALAIAQDQHHVLTMPVIEAVADYLGMAPIAVHEVATFYNMYHIKPVGRFKVAVCTCLPCELRDGAKAGEYMKSRLGIDYNETTDDGLFTLVESECLGSCGDAPVMLVNNKQMCSFMSADRMDALIEELRRAGVDGTTTGPGWTAGPGSIPGPGSPAGPGSPESPNSNPPVDGSAVAEGTAVPNGTAVPLATVTPGATATSSATAGPGAAGGAKAPTVSKPAQGPAATAAGPAPAAGPDTKPKAKSKSRNKKKHGG